MPEQSVVVEKPSGKDKQDENFPVGSLLIAKRYRRHVHIYYRFARQADDVADDPALPSGEKLRRLDRMAAVLNGDNGDDAPAAATMHVSLLETGVSPDHCHDLLRAFRQDAVKHRYTDWNDLLDYCRYSAVPVGRYLLDLHGVSRDSWAASDALCAALQVLNHLQDCQKDYRTMNRVYLPLDSFQAASASLGDLEKDHCPAPLRTVLNDIILKTEPLVNQALTLPSFVGNAGLRRESAVIAAIARRLLDKLRHHDPLAQRVKLNRFDLLCAVAEGLCRWH